MARLSRALRLFGSRATAFLYSASASSQRRFSRNTSPSNDMHARGIRVDLSCAGKACDGQLLVGLALPVETLRTRLGILLNRCAASEAV